MTTEPEKIKQCPSCPWRVECVPDRDIPNYKRDLHEGLTNTIQEGLGTMFCKVRHIMACHYSKVGEEFPCAGWLSNQIGSGNNIGLRLAVMTGQMPVPEVDGPQHETFEQTLCSGETPTASSTTSPKRGSRTRRPRVMKSTISNGDGGRRGSTASRRRA
jgi:hypothetical protein